MLSILVLALAGCAPGDGSPSLEQLQQELEAPGPYAVGHTFLDVTYTPPGTEEARVLPVEVWYPAPEGTSGGAAVYAIAGIVDVPSDVAIAEAPGADGPFPVAVYSHGSGGVGMLAYPTAERLASRGWVVLAPDHVGNTSLELAVGGGASFVRNALYRPLDVRAVLDAVEAGLPGSRAEGLGSTEDVFVWGHSFGGYTTLVAGGAALDEELLRGGCTEDCELLDTSGVKAALAAGLGDPRVDAIAPQAPALVGLFTRRSLKELAPPVQLQSAMGDRTTPDDEEATPLWEALVAPEDRWVRLTKGGHYSFITTCDDVGVELVETFSPGALEDGCGEISTPIAEITPVIGTYLVAWAEAHVRGQTQYLAVVDEQRLHADVRVREP